MFLLMNSRHNYILYLKGLGYKAVRLLTHKEMYRSHFKSVPSEDSSSVKEKKMIRIIKFVFFALASLAVVAGGYKAVTYKIDTLKKAQIEVSTVTADKRQKQLDCLARNIYHEAGYEPFEGKVAVAQVTINRAESGQFPSDICKVVYQKNVVYEKVVCQFSWYCDSGMRVKPVHSAAYVESMEVAKKVLLEGFQLSVLKDALYYHANYVNPRWPLEKIGSIGNHIFYRK